MEPRPFELLLSYSEIVKKKRRARFYYQFNTLNKQYNSTQIEAKWQKRWEEDKIYSCDLKTAKKPYYTHVMFPYPSGDKLHVGHWYNFGPADTFARFKKLQGYDVFSPIGFDSFGLPAENYAIKTGVHPRESITENVKTMTTQLKRMGCMYDWGKTLSTSTTEYYKWTQFLFLQLYKKGLAYQKEALVNWDPVDQTVLANEQVLPDGTAERSGAKVVQKPLKQWFFKTTEYKQELLNGLENLDWPKQTKIMQKNWIGRSEGINFTEKIKDLDIEFQVFDTIPQTYLAQTFTVIAPEHKLVPKLVQGTEYEKEAMEFVERIKVKKAAGKFNIEEDLEGVFTGRYVDNPFGTGDLPIWIASFVVADYGTGMVNCSAHDIRDYNFAKKYNIPLRIELLPEDKEHAKRVLSQEEFYREPDGILQSPEPAKGMRWNQARETVIKYIEEQGYGKRGVNYRLRDWLLSRQRYWGAPIPVVYDPDGNAHPVLEEHLPWTLPDDVEFKPQGFAPLAQSEELKKRVEDIFGKGWTPEVDTMDTFVCSSFYSNRYLADGDQEQFVDKEIEEKWMPVDCYIGGAEHACMHLIYARFIQMALADVDLVKTREPYQRLVHQGTITNQGAKMSKSKGNVVSPDQFIEDHGADVFRMYLMFMGPYEHGGDWSDTGINGTSRFIKKVYNFFSASKLSDQDPKSETLKVLHQTIKKTSEDLESLSFNTAISALMILFNQISKQEQVNEAIASNFLILLAPFAPHLSEELWHEVLGNTESIFNAKWPNYDPALVTEEEVEIVVQVNGKIRGRMNMSVDASKEELEANALAIETVKKYIDSSNQIKKTIVVPKKLVNFVV